MKVNQSIIFFDGVCGLCNRFVDYVIRHDKANIFVFSTLQGETAKSLGLEMHIDPARASFYLFQQNKIYERSTAALMVLKELDTFLAVLSFFLIFPSFLRDPIYKVIAKNRYKWFGQRETCRIPTEEERNKFLP